MIVSATFTWQMNRETKRHTFTYMYIIELNIHTCLNSGFCMYSAYCVSICVRTVSPLNFENTKQHVGCWRASERGDEDENFCKVGKHEIATEHWTLLCAHLWAIKLNMFTWHWQRQYSTHTRAHTHHIQSLYSFTYIKLLTLPRVKRVLKTQNSVNEDNNITINNENEINFAFSEIHWNISRK